MKKQNLCDVLVNRLLMIFFIGFISICLFLSCNIVDPNSDSTKKIESQRISYWYSFMDTEFVPTSKIPAILSSEVENEILGIYLNEINSEFGWNLTIDDVWVENYYGIYNDSVAVLLYNDYQVPGEGVYINNELEIVVDTVSFLYGPLTGSTIVIYNNGKIYNLRDAYDKELLDKNDLKNIAYYQNEGFILPEREIKKPLEKKIIWEGNISNDFDDRTVIIIADKNYSSWRLFADDFTGVDVIKVRSLMVRRLMKYPGDNFGDIISIEIGNIGKQNVVDAIRKLEKLDFIKCAEPNYIMYPADD